MQDSMALVRRDYLNNFRARSSMADAAWDVSGMIGIYAKSPNGYGMSDLHSGFSRKRGG